MFIFFSRMDIKIFTYGLAKGAGKGRVGGVIRSEKWENHKYSTHPILKSDYT